MLYWHFYTARAKAKKFEIYSHSIVVVNEHSQFLEGAGTLKDYFFQSGVKVIQAVNKAFDSAQNSHLTVGTNSLPSVLPKYRGAELRTKSIRARIATSVACFVGLVVDPFL